MQWVEVVLLNSRAVSALDYFRAALRNKGARIGRAYLLTEKNGVISLPSISFPVREGQAPEEVREKVRKMLVRYPGAEYLFDDGEVVTGVDTHNRRAGKVN